MKDKYCSVYVRNSNEGPACYYRIIQYISKLDGRFEINNVMTRNMYRNNLNCKNKFVKLGLRGYYYIIMLCRTTFFLLRDIINKPEYVIIQRTVLPRFTPLFLITLLKTAIRNTTVYWDFDDEIVLNGEISIRQKSVLSRYSKNIIVTNEYLKNSIDEMYRDKVILLPTTDGDLQGFDPNLVLSNRQSTFQNQINLVWVATGGNIPSLIKIMDILDEAAKQIKNNQNKQLVLSVVCNKPVNSEVRYLKIENIKWSRERAKEAIFNAHIGIMPLIYSEFALGKGGFKLVQYISAGLPVIASRVGFNVEVVKEGCGFLVDDLESNDSWLTAIEQIISSWEHWSDLSNNAYNHWADKFSYDHNLDFWRKLIKL